MESKDKAFTYIVKKQDVEEFMILEKQYVDENIQSTIAFLDKMADKTFANIYHEFVKIFIIKKFELVERELTDLSDYIRDIIEANSSGDLHQYLFGKSLKFQLANSENDSTN